MASEDNDEELSSSVIGTKDYWDKCYAQELDNYNEFGDFGEIWFGLKNSRRIVNWIRDNVSDKDTIKVLDIGCGNGFLLLELAKLGYRQLYGVDYSPISIEFCRQVALKELQSIDCSIIFEELDIISDNKSDKSVVLNQKFDCLIDKGTFDAICLMPETDLTLVRDKYRRFVTTHMSKNSVFILMSCNFTKSQLYKHLNLDDSFQLIYEMESPSICFGGQTGSQVTGLVLKKT